MPKCVKLKRKKRQVCIGDLDTVIVLQSRAITPPTTNVDFAESFTGLATVWARMGTGRGKTSFDDSEIEVDITHEFTIRFLAGVTSETWVLFENRRFDIIDVEDLEERHEWMILRCALRGINTKAVNDA